MINLNWLQYARKYFNMGQSNLYTCIVFFTRKNSLMPHKYRNVNNIARFEKFARKLGASYFNVYSKRTAEFIQRIYVN